MPEGPSDAPLIASITFNLVSMTSTMTRFSASAFTFSASGSFSNVSMVSFFASSSCTFSLSSESSCRTSVFASSFHSGVPIFLIFAESDAGSPSAGTSSKMSLCSRMDLFGCVFDKNYTIFASFYEGLLVMILSSSSSIQSPVERLEEDESAEFVRQGHGGEPKEEICLLAHSLIKSIRTTDHECHRATEIFVLHQKLCKGIGR